MTTGQIVGGAVGAFFGGALGAQIGITLGGLVDPPKGPTIEGPRLSDLSVQTSTYGVGVPYIIATAAVYGNVFWLENNQLKEVARDDDSGGKGGGGSQTTRTFEYFATFAVAVNDAEIADALRVWVGPDLISNPASTDTETLIATAQFRDGIVYGGNATVPQTTPQPGTFRVYFGKDDQAVDPRMEADLGVGATPAYRGVAYIVFYDWPLAKYSNSLQVAQVKAEVAVSTSSGAASLLNALTLTSFNNSGNYDEPTCPFISPAQ
ncbi:MAG TPA: hypothetical protein DCZ13_04430 [Porticoccaceae bacterium]|nr:hypothetical protein [Porticoccaceae bacterium]